MSSFLPEKCFVVCTKHVGFGYRKLLHDGGGRTQFTVILKIGDRRWLTVGDRKIDEDFNCQSQWSSVVAAGAFGAGLAVGICILAAIPVVGWIGLGIVAAVAIGFALVSYFLNKTQCSDRLGSAGSKWVLEHPTVIFNGHKAVNKRSILQCQEGGSLLPFISESLAAEAARTIGLINSVDLGLNALASFISGLMLGRGLSFGSVGMFLGVGMPVGIFIVPQLTDWLVSKPTQGLSEYFDLGGETYKNINSTGIDAPNRIGPDTEWDPLDVREVYQDVRSIRQMAVQNGASNQSIAQLDAALRSAETNGSFSPKKNPAMQSVINNIRNGVYGEDVRARFTNRNGNMRGMNRQLNYERSIESKRQSIRTNQAAQNKSRWNIRGNVVQIIQPFAGALFSEVVKITAAQYAEQDMGNGSGVVAKDN